MDFTIVMITCPGREAMREQTLRNLARTDWPAFQVERVETPAERRGLDEGKDKQGVRGQEAGGRRQEAGGRDQSAPLTPSVFVSLDRYTCERKQERQLLNARDALRLGVNAGRRWILFLEDDLEFNQHLYHNLVNWPILEDVAMASLYNPTVNELRRCADHHYFIANPKSVYGSQAYLFSIEMALYLVEHWHEVEGMQDIKCSRLAARHGPIYYYQPSLVQHVGKDSAWGGSYHYTRDYDAEFKIQEAEIVSRGQEAGIRSHGTADP